MGRKRAEKNDNVANRIQSLFLTWLLAGRVFDVISAGARCQICSRKLMTGGNVTVSLQKSFERNYDFPAADPTTTSLPADS